MIISLIEPLSLRFHFAQDYSCRWYFASQLIADSCRQSMLSRFHIFSYLRKIPFLLPLLKSLMIFFAAFSSFFAASPLLRSSISFNDIFFFFISLHASTSFQRWALFWVFFFFIFFFFLRHTPRFLLLFWAMMLRATPRSQQCLRAEFATFFI